MGTANGPEPPPVSRGDDIATAEFIFVAVLGLLAIFLLLAIWGAASELRAGMGVRGEVIGFMFAVFVLLLLGVFAYSKKFDRTGPSSHTLPHVEGVASRNTSDLSSFMRY